MTYLKDKPSPLTLTTTVFS